MRILPPVMMMLILIGCENAASVDAVQIILDPLVTQHAAALGSDDISDMRATGLDLIATYDALFPGDTI